MSSVTNTGLVTQSNEGPGRPCTEQRKQASHWLSPWVFACSTREGTVLLDLRQGRYLALGHDDAQMLAVQVIDWPSHPSAQFRGPDISAQTNADGVLSDLVRSGLLDGHDPKWVPIRSTSMRVDGSLVAVGEELERYIPTTIGHLWNFWIAYLSARVSLHYRPFYKVVRAINRFKELRSNSHEGFDEQRAAELVGVFRRLRPYAFTAKAQCLLHALTLVTFLARYGVFAMWTIGVKTDPWGAHSWVQHSEFILDSNPEKICEFTPILSV